MPERALYLAHRARIRGETRQGSGSHRTFPRDELPAPHAGPCCSGQPGRGATCLRALQKPLVRGAWSFPIISDRGCVSRDLEILTTPGRQASTTYRERPSASLDISE